MGDNERRNLIVTAAVCAVLTLICLIGIHFDRQAVYAGEIPEDDPEGEAAANEIPEEEWGERRWIQEIKKQMDTDQKEADQMVEREQQVIVFREIVARDASVLPDVEDVNKFAETVRDFESASGVLITNVTGLQAKVGAGAVSPLPISLRLEGTFDQFLKFLNMFESFNRLINTRSFSITAGDPFDNQGVKEAIHTINLSLVTYVYQAKGGNLQPVDIQDYDKQKADPEIQKQIRELKAPRLETYLLPARPSRRDPFIEDRVPKIVDPEGEEIGREEQQKVYDLLYHDLRLVETDVKQFTKLSQAGKHLQAATLRQTITEKMSELDTQLLSAQKSIQIADIKEELQQKIVQRFEELKDTLNVAKTDLVITGQQAREFHSPMQNAFEREDYKEVLSVWKSFQTFVLGRELSDEAKPIADKMTVLATRAQHHIDFENLKLSWSAVIHMPSTPAKSRAIIDGKARQVGDFVDDQKHCELKEIQQDSLLFLFKGVEEIKVER